MGKVIGLTGGIASGKSEVSRTLEALGMPVLDADVVARELVEPGTPALAELAARFGPEALTPEGRLDRAWMRAHVFAQPERRRELEAILHPRVELELRQRASRCVAPVVLVVVPLLAEVGRYPWFDEVVVVDATLAQQRERLLRRDGIEATLAERMIAAQAARGTRLALADHVISNTGTRESLRRATERLHVTLGAGRGAPAVNP